MTFISWGSSSDLEEMQEFFYSIDTFGCGAIDETDLVQGMLELFSADK